MPKVVDPNNKKFFTMTALLDPGESERNMEMEVAWGELGRHKRSLLYENDAFISKT